jgi:hypothetical protein
MAGREALPSKVATFTVYTRTCMPATSHSSVKTAQTTSNMYIGRCRTSPTKLPINHTGYTALPVGTYV